MILTKLTVSGFGKLKGYSTTFDKEINTFVFENGWGKTTLSDFIYAMFYGLAQTTKKKLTDNLRKKYQPWDGGTFGGSLDFIHDGKKYSIERTFGSTAKDDTFKLIDLETNKESNDYTEEIGLEIFGIERDSFERSIYVPQKDLESKFDESLKSKLANIIGGTNDVQNFNSAITLLEKNKNEIKRKTVGKYFDKKSELADLEKQIEICNNNVGLIPKLEKSISDLKENISTTSIEQENIYNEIKEFNDYQTYKQALGQLHVHQEELEQLKESLTSKEKILNGNDGSGLQECRNNIETCERLKLERDLLRKNIANQKVENVISNEEMEKLENKLSDLDNVQIGMTRIGVFLGVGIGIVILGLLILLLVDKFLGGIVAGVGVLSTLIFSVLLSNNKKKKPLANH